MSDDSDDEEPPVLQYHRISATAVDAILVATPADFPSETDKMWHVRSLLTNPSPGADGQWQPAPLSFIVEWCLDIKLWGTDRQRHRYACYMDENGLTHELDPNHRMNAMVDAGRFTTLTRHTVDDCKNQRLKEHQGSNYFYGDIVVAVPVGFIPPDHNVYGADPISSITGGNSPSQAMIDRYGETLAEQKISHCRAYDLSNMEAIIRNGTMQWKLKPYRIAPYGMTDTMKQLLLTWNYTEEQIRIMNMMGF